MRATNALLCAGAALGMIVADAWAQSGENGFPATSAAKPVPIAPASKVIAAAPDAKTTPPKQPADVVPAKVLFGAVKQPAPVPPSSVGGYASGCLAGGRALPVDGTAWQAMRLSRNRNWGHPDLIRFLEGFAVAAQKHDGWPGMLLGDLSQPRGGPMSSGHASHQIGLDADIWLMPMPSHRLSVKEREEISAINMVAADKLSVNPAVWDAPRARIIKRAATSPQVERIFVAPAIKKALCESASSMGPDRSWLSKVRAYWGHDHHFHVRIACPKDSANCKAQPPPPSDDGCGAELTGWFKRVTAPPKPPGPPGPKKPPPPPVTLDRLPAECRVVLETGISRGVVKSGAVNPTAAPAAPK